MSGIKKTENVRHRVNLPRRDLEHVLRRCLGDAVPKCARFELGVDGAAFFWDTRDEQPVTEAHPAPGMVDFVFDTDGAEGPMGGRLVEVEDTDGRSVRVGEWLRRDGRDVLRVKVER